MGYFANGTEGEIYEAKYCRRCLNYDSEMGCPILNLHLLWNYDSVGKDADKTKSAALNHFIPRSDDGLTNQQCRMFRIDPAVVERKRLAEWNAGKPIRA